MPKIKIRDLRPSNHNRKQVLWNILMRSNLLVYQMKELGRSAFLIISSDEVVEKLLSTNMKEKLKKENFEVQTPPEFIANKTIVLRNVDAMITQVDPEELRQDLENRNDWIKVEEVILIPNAPKIIKIRTESAAMAKTAVEKGIYIYIISQFLHLI